MFVKQIPPTSKNADITFFFDGFRLSSRFIMKERLESMVSVELFVDKTSQKIGLKFHPGYIGDAVKLTKAGSNTSGRTVSCTFLKKHEFIRKIMEGNKIGEKRFNVQKTTDVVRIQEGIEYLAYIGE